MLLDKGTLLFVEMCYLKQTDFNVMNSEFTEKWIYIFDIIYKLHSTAITFFGLKLYLLCWSFSF